MLTSQYSKPTSAFSLETEIKSAIQSAIAAEVQKEIELAKQRIQEKIPEILAAVTIRLGGYMEFHRNLNHLVIDVRFEDKK